MTHFSNDNMTNLKMTNVLSSNLKNDKYFNVLSLSGKVAYLQKQKLENCKYLKTNN